MLVWRQIASYSGTGYSQTSSFTSDTGSLRFRWEAKDTSGSNAGRIKVTVHSAISGRPLDDVVEQVGSGRDTSFLFEEPRVFYLVVDATSMTWTVAVDEGVSGELVKPGDP